MVIRVSSTLLFNAFWVGIKYNIFEWICWCRIIIIYIIYTFTIFLYLLPVSSSKIIFFPCHYMFCMMCNCNTVYIFSIENDYINRLQCVCSRTRTYYNMYVVLIYIYVIILNLMTLHTRVKSYHTTYYILYTLNNPSVGVVAL